MTDKQWSILLVCIRIFLHQALRDDKLSRALWDQASALSKELRDV